MDDTELDNQTPIVLLVLQFLLLLLLPILMLVVLLLLLLFPLTYVMNPVSITVL